MLTVPPPIPTTAPPFFHAPLRTNTFAITYAPRIVQRMVQAIFIAPRCTCSAYPCYPTLLQLRCSASLTDAVTPPITSHAGHYPRPPLPSHVISTASPPIPSCTPAHCIDILSPVRSLNPCHPRMIKSRHFPILALKGHICLLSVYLAPMLGHG